MPMKTTSTTNNAGPSPAPREAHQRAVGDEEPFVTCHGCVHLRDVVEYEADDVGWCEYHWQYRSIAILRQCQGAEFFDR